MLWTSRVGSSVSLYPRILIENIEMNGEKKKTKGRGGGGRVNEDLLTRLYWLLVKPPSTKLTSKKTMMSTLSTR